MSPTDTQPPIATAIWSGDADLPRLRAEERGQRRR